MELPAKEYDNNRKLNVTGISRPVSFADTPVNVKNVFVLLASCE
jgi:hypothetical protein